MSCRVPSSHSSPARPTSPLRRVPMLCIIPLTTHAVGVRSRSTSSSERDGGNGPATIPTFSRLLRSCVYAPSSAVASWRICVPVSSADQYAVRHCGSLLAGTSMYQRFSLSTCVTVTSVLTRSLRPRARSGAHKLALFFAAERFRIFAPAETDAAPARIPPKLAKAQRIPAGVTAQYHGVGAGPLVFSHARPPPRRPSGSEQPRIFQATVATHRGAAPLVRAVLVTPCPVRLPGLEPVAICPRRDLPALPNDSRHVSWHCLSLPPICPRRD